MKNYVVVRVDASPDEYPLRINRFLALARVSTRREADALVERGLVRVNGEPAAIGLQIEEGDVVEVESSVVSRRSSLAYVAFNKPAGADTDDASAAIRFKPAVRPAGRLDKDDEGLVILTNDAKAADLLQHPEARLVRSYRARTQEKVNDGFVDRLARAAEAAGLGRAKGEATGDTGFAIDVAATPKELRRLCEGLHHTVLKLRLSTIGPVGLKGIAPGAWRRIEGDELARLLRSLGL